MVVELRQEGDNANAIAAIRALNQTLQNYMELSDMVKPKKEDNYTKNVINIISDKYDLRDRAHSADFRIIESEEKVVNGQV